MDDRHQRIQRVLTRSARRRPRYPHQPPAVSAAVATPAPHPEPRLLLPDDRPGSTPGAEILNLLRDLRAPASASSSSATTWQWWRTLRSPDRQNEGRIVEELGVGERGAPRGIPIRSNLRASAGYDRATAALVSSPTIDAGCSAAQRHCRRNVSRLAANQCSAIRVKAFWISRREYGEGLVGA
jgi:hypothetical protein